MDNLPGSHRLGVFVPWLDSVWVCAQIWARCVVGASGSFCVDAQWKARSGNSFHDLRRLRVWMDRLPDEIFCMAVSHPLVHRDVYYYRRGWINLKWNGSRLAPGLVDKQTRRLYD